MTGTPPTSFLWGEVIRPQHSEVLAPEYKLFITMLYCLSKVEIQSSRRGAVETNPTRNHEVVGLILGLAQCVKDLALPRAAQQL